MIKKNILISIFTRKGGEGINTKMITEDLNLLNKVNSKIKENENPLLIYFINDENWTLFTDIKILINEKSQLKELLYNQLMNVKPALSAEIKNGITETNDFTKLLLTFKDKSSIIISVEKGLPFKGIYQMLHYVSSMSE
nr:hypothetical protein [uncultured Chryseobacterium sp.]